MHVLFSKPAQYLARFKAYIHHYFLYTFASVAFDNSQKIAKNEYNYRYMKKLSVESDGFEETIRHNIYKKNKVSTPTYNIKLEPRKF
jgi:hypothetical protein